MLNRKCYCENLSVEVTLMVYHKSHICQIKSKTLKHSNLMDLNLLTSNGLIIKSCCYDFNDTACIVNISL